MSEGEMQKSWWSTLPGILTGVAATVTALGGLVIAINNTGWFGSDETRPASHPVAEAPAADSPDAAAAAPVASTATVNAAGSSEVALPEQREYTLGSSVFTVLSASLGPRNTESKTLTLRLRMLNNSPYDANFWDRQFRLMIDGVPRAPESGLNMVVEGRAAGDGDVVFVVPVVARTATLRINHGDEQTDIPLGLVH
jgi:hypothetical protein